MTARPSNPGDPTPPPFNEEHMLEWVEGRLSRIEEANRAASTRPGVSDRVRQMQANRRALQSLGNERAPAELMDRVLAALERDALLGLTNGQDVSDHPPINIATHQVTRSRDSRLQKWAPQLALAAGLLLLVSGAAYWGSALIKPVQKGPLVTTVTPEAPTTPINPATPDQGTRIAANDNPATTDAAMTTTAATPAANALAVSEEMTDERILRLAREGRLVIRVQSKDLSRLAQVEAMNSFRDGRTWRISKDVPQEVTVAIATPKAPAISDPSGTIPTIASDIAARIGTNAVGFPVPFEFTAVETRTYLVDFPDTQKSLSAIRTVLSDRLKATVEFEELDAPITLPRVEDPDALLWWTLPPTSWTQRVTVPVVVR